MSQVIKKNKINYVMLFLHCKVATETILTHYGYEQEIINSATDIVRELLKQNILLEVCQPTVWEKQQLIPAVIDKAIIDVDRQSELDRQLLTVVRNNSCAVAELLEYIDEIMLSSDILDNITQHDGWQVLTIREVDGCFIEITSHGDYRILAWEYMLEQQNLTQQEVKEDTPEQDQINQFLSASAPMVGTVERFETNVFENTGKSKR